MSTPNTDGGPAFPSTESYYTGSSQDGDRQLEIGSAGGMTLRDYFAAKAMQGAITEGALPRIIKEVAEEPSHVTLDEAVKITNSLLAKMSYDIADAMLIARQPKQ